MRAVLARDFGIRTRWVDRRRATPSPTRSCRRGCCAPTASRRVVLVTSSNHEWRAAHEFASAGSRSCRRRSTYRRPPRTAEPLPAEPLALLQSSEALYELLGDVVRELFAATHLRRHSAEGARAR